MSNVVDKPRFEIYSECVDCVFDNKTGEILMSVVNKKWAEVVCSLLNDNDGRGIYPGDVAMTIWDEFRWMVTKQANETCKTLFCLWFCRVGVVIVVIGSAYLFLTG